MQSLNLCLDRGSRLCETHARSNKFGASSGRFHQQQQSGALQSKRWLFRGLIGGTIILTGMGMGQGSFGRGFTVFAQTDKIAEVLKDPKWPDEFPFSASDFERADEEKDAVFYQYPRFVKHIDDKAIDALTKYYTKVFPKGKNQNVAMLDMCSSWISHYPKDFQAGRIVGLGMNKAELEENPILTEVTVQDLNADPKLPYDDNSFDFVTNAVSVDYLCRPLEIFQEVHRVLKPGGTAIMSFSNRCFPTKVIRIWLQTSDPDHIWIVGSYFRYSVPSGFTDIRSIDISPGRGPLGLSSDPMYVVQATKAPLPTS